MMWPRNGKTMLPWLVVALASILVGLGGCAEVEVVDSTPAAASPDLFGSPLPAGQEKHDLAVMAADVDPPLNYQQLILHRQSVALLVVIENMGSGTERGITVQAQLTSPEDPSLSLTREARVTSIAPGEIQIVRFSRLGEIPYRQTYRLEVTVVPLPGETDVVNNRKAFDIQIHQK
jgi:hypothetical protein